jgi:hypothetical protein
VGDELEADTCVPELEDEPVDDDVPDDACVVVTAAAAVVCVVGWCAVPITASVAPNRSALQASRAAAVRRGERPGRTRRLGTRALRMEIAPGEVVDGRTVVPSGVPSVCDRRICPR